MHEFFSFNFPLRKYLFGTSLHKFCNGPSLKWASVRPGSDAILWSDTGATSDSDGVPCVEPK